MPLTTQELQLKSIQYTDILYIPAGNVGVRDTHYIYVLRHRHHGNQKTLLKL
jgi:hypothetical protein